MNGVHGIAMQKIEQAMRGVEARFAEIESRTGLTFSAHLLRSQLTQPSGVETASSRGNEEPAPVVFDDSEPIQAARAEGFSRMPESEYDDLIAEIAERYSLNAALIKAICFAESNFRPGAVSQSGAMGLMQLMPYTAEALGVDDPFDPRQNVDGGARLLAQHLDRFNGDALLAVAAYNCGPNGVASRGITDLNDPEQRGWLPSETQGYLERIERYLDAAQALYVLDNPFAA